MTNDNRSSYRHYREAVYARLNQYIFALDNPDEALRCFQWVTQREVMYAGSGWVRVGSWSLAAMR
jgi:hypothetical protein